jgi:hypothetical protein
MKTRILKALNKTWNELNPNSSNPFIVPQTTVPHWIAIYGGDDEAAQAFLALPVDKQTGLLQEAFPAYFPAVERIQTALVALMENYDKEAGSVVIIEEPKSRKFVQFGPGWELIMDVPFVALTNEEADRAYSFFADFGEEPPHEYNAPDPQAEVVRHGATFNVDFDLDAHAAAAAAVSFFEKVYLLPPDEVALSIRKVR